MSQMNYGNKDPNSVFHQNDEESDFSIDNLKNWSAKNESDLQLMSQKHENLIGLILTEEEEVISSHRQHIDDMVELTKQVITCKMLLNP